MKTALKNSFKNYSFYNDKNEICRKNMGGRWNRRRALAGSNVSKQLALDNVSKPLALDNVSKPLALDNVSKVVRAGLFSNGGV